MESEVIKKAITDLLAEVTDVDLLDLIYKIVVASL